MRLVISSGEYRFERVVVAVHNFSRAACSVRIKWPEGTGELLHLFGRRVHAPLAADSQAIDLDGYDYRWMKVRSAGRAA